MKSKVYDFLKWVALVGLPAAGLLYQQLAAIWGWPYGDAVMGSIVAVDTALGTWVGVSSHQYQKKQKQAGGM